MEQPDGHAREPRATRRCREFIAFIRSWWHGRDQEKNNLRMGRISVGDTGEFHRADDGLEQHGDRSAMMITIDDILQDSQNGHSDLQMLAFITG